MLVIWFKAEARSQTGKTRDVTRCVRRPGATGPGQAFIDNFDSIHHYGPVAVVSILLLTDDVFLGRSLAYSTWNSHCLNIWAAVVS